MNKLCQTILISSFDRIVDLVNGEEAAIVLYVDFSKDFDIILWHPHKQREAHM